MSWFTILYVEHVCSCYAYFSNIFLDIDECKNTSICHENATCHNTPGSYTCTCKAGMSGDGRDNCVGKFCSEFLLDKGKCSK